jgi:hypothetical protein
MDSNTRKSKIDDHLESIRKLEAEEAETQSVWPPPGYYLLWHVVIGAVLGSIGATVSLLANALGAPLFGEKSLQLIRVYLTFPMGAQALEAETGLVVFVGVCLYLGTGAIFGIGFHLLMSTIFAAASNSKRFVVSTLIGLALWIANFYLILGWLQPMLQGDNWIVRLVPFWVAALTHLAFVWTMFLGEFWGKFETNAPRTA